MAIPAAVLGALKVALKNAGKEVLKEVTKKGIAEATTKEALKKLTTSAMTDAQATILNRIKTAPTKALIDLASNEMGIPVKEIKQIVKIFKQTPKMAELAKGEKFKELARRTLKKELKLTNVDKIKDIMRKAEEYNANKKDNNIEDFSAKVRSLLIEIENELADKVKGFTENGTELSFNTNVTKFFKAKDKYTVINVRALEVVLKNLVLDAERYISGSMEELAIIQEGAKWGVYTRQEVFNWIKSIKQDVKLCLQVGGK